jgi:hypothetical protein
LQRMCLRKQWIENEEKEFKKIWNMPAKLIVGPSLSKQIKEPREPLDLQQFSTHFGKFGFRCPLPCLRWYYLLTAFLCIVNERPP